MKMSSSGVFIAQSQKDLSSSRSSGIKVVKHTILTEALKMAASIGISNLIIGKLAVVTDKSKSDLFPRLKSKKENS